MYIEKNNHIVEVTRKNIVTWICYKNEVKYSYLMFHNKNIRYSCDVCGYQLLESEIGFLEFCRKFGHFK